MSDVPHGRWTPGLSVGEGGLSADAIMRRHPKGDYVQSDDYDAALATIERLQAQVHEGEQQYDRQGFRLHARIRELEAAIRWALGEEGKFPDEPEPQGKYRRKYYWRIELRKRAALAPPSQSSGEGKS